LAIQRLAVLSGGEPGCLNLTRATVVRPGAWCEQGIAQVGGKKELTGRTDIEIEISNQCARLIANTIIYYNSAILSHPLTKCAVRGNAKAVALITRMSPAAWRHILLNGHYTFQSSGKMIDLDALLAGLDLE